MGSRNLAILTTFCGYHIAKFGLWRYGYFATFFYRTRLLTLIPLCWGLWYSTLKKYPQDLQSVDLFDYVQKKVRFEKDQQMVMRLLQNRADFMLEAQKDK
jgi:hypothetical protein